MKNIRTLINSATLAGTGLLLSAQNAFAADIKVPGTFFSNISEVINQVLTFVMAIAALLVFMYLILGGIDWITSGGDKSKTESARNKITAAVIGLIILAAAYAILTIALNFLGAGSLNEILNSANID